MPALLLCKQSRRENRTHDKHLQRGKLSQDQILQKRKEGSVRRKGECHILRNGPAQLSRRERDAKEAFYCVKARKTSNAQGVGSRCLRLFSQGGSERVGASNARQKGERKNNRRSAIEKKVTEYLSWGGSCLWGEIFGDFSSISGREEDMGNAIK